MRNIRLLIQYDGTAYSGWQSQPDAATIQGLLEGCLKKITGEDISVIAAGRTDAGVHALGQVACLRTSSGMAPDVLRNALDALLPVDIRIMRADEADESFHARFSARSKSYVYIISTDRIIAPFLHRYVWRLPYNLDIAAMKESIPYFDGTHDFSAFRGSGCGARTAVRTIIKSSLEAYGSFDFMVFRLSGNFIKVRFEGDAFLRHMVRNMVGTLVEVGRGRIKPSDIEIIMKGLDRRCAGPTAPACGLFLENITY
ncbi:MAG TPA: tRNA pseudouridine(38-40) synthase TruA [Dissulfurispiraceae bacterium]|nr:tRNA pseudouridine(38-40) synthase TruA [Dissulfurispiraceae bacterium]